MIANISLAYKPQVHSFQPLTTDAGVEYLTVAFPLTKYPGHLMVSVALPALPTKCPASQAKTRLVPGFGGAVIGLQG